MRTSGISGYRYVAWVEAAFPFESVALASTVLVDKRALGLHFFNLHLSSLENFLVTV